MMQSQKTKSKVHMAENISTFNLVNFCVPIIHVSRAFTLIETLVAISLLVLAVIQPMSLTAQSLKSAYYARDQITASNLAQEAIESVRSVRDRQALISNLTGDPIDIFYEIPINEEGFIIDVRDNTTRNCVSACPLLQTDGIFYGYGMTGALDTVFTRTVHASYVNGSSNNEILIKSTVSWRTGSYPLRSVTLYQNLYRLIDNR